VTGQFFVDNLVYKSAGIGFQALAGPDQLGRRAEVDARISQHRAKPGTGYDDKDEVSGGKHRRQIRRRVHGIRQRDTRQVPAILAVPGERGCVFAVAVPEADLVTILRQ
jgi:hypothetical protein